MEMPEPLRGADRMCSLGRFPDEQESALAVSRQDFEDAVAAYWGVKDTQLEVSKIRNAVGAGTAGSVRSGKHFDALAALLAKFFLDAGYPPADIRISGQGLSLPGYYRPQKKWDVVVTHGTTLVAAFELKALGGGKEDDGYSKNYNNRIEEALGSAVDLQRASQPPFYSGEKPWLGYFFIMEDTPGSRSAIRIDNGPFSVEDKWYGMSYQGRFAEYCRRLKAEEIYDEVCYITSSASDPKPKEPVDTLDWLHFSAAINSRIQYLAELGIPQDDMLPL
ncbi:PaeR7I family type II restriction endonuclease [Streptomyces sp. NPDC059900]|uniref:PaeR7I family type II restriction endonuclease n=1 Tax=Streptomyces sp. NPDC059900 TaxID=3155816 RepID=UPI00342DA690